MLPQLGQPLSQEFGKGFDASNLRYMRLFYQAFPICDALRHKLSWTHYRLLLRVDAPEARQWYMQEAATQNWSTRVLERHLGTLYHERLLSSQDKGALVQSGRIKELAFTHDRHNPTSTQPDSVFCVYARV